MEAQHYRLLTWCVYLSHNNSFNETHSEIITSSSANVSLRKKKVSSIVLLFVNGAFIDVCCERSLVFAFIESVSTTFS